MAVPAVVRRVLLGVAAPSVSSRISPHRTLYWGISNSRLQAVTQGRASTEMVSEHSALYFLRHHLLAKKSILGKHLNSLPSAWLCLRQKPLCTDRVIGDHRCFHSSTRNEGSDSINNLAASAGASQPAWPAQSTETLIETWNYTVAPRGSLHLKLPFKTVVRPLSPQEFPDMDKVIVEVHFDKTCGAAVPASSELSHIGDLYQLTVLFDRDTARMSVTASVTAGVTLPLVCLLWIPLQSDLNAAVSSDEDIAVESLESGVINVATQHGNCYLKKLKCGSVNVQSKAGNIESKSNLLGNVIFHTGGAGSISADKVQGSSIVWETELGSVAVRSLYCDSAVIRTTGGSCHLGQCHGQLILQAGQADVKVESLEGDIDIGLLTGNVDVHLSRHANTNIDVKNGDIHLSFPEGISTDLDLDGQRITVNENVPLEYRDTDIPHHKEGYIGEQGKAYVHARTLSGIVTVKLLDWIQTTRLAFKTDTDT